MTDHQSTPIAHNNHPDLRYPGWFNPLEHCRHQTSCECKPDPLTMSIVHREVNHAAEMIQAWSKEGGWSKERTEASLAEERREMLDYLYGPIEEEWANEKYTILDGGEVKYISHVPRLDFLDIFSLDSLNFVRASVEPSLALPGMLKIIFEASDDSFPFPRHPDMSTEETWLYRMFDEAGVLLYIGISRDAFIRFAQHAKDKPWISQVAKWERESYPSRAQALRAEKAAIQAEHPLYNVVHNGGIR